MCLLLLLLLVPLTTRAESAKNRIGVLYFDYGKEDDYAQLRKGLAQMLITDLAGDGSLEVVERTRLEDLLAELDLQASKRIDPSTAVKAGKLLGARFLVYGSYFILGETLMIDARALEVETGLLKGFRAKGSPDSFFELEQELAAKLAGHFAALPAVELEAPKKKKVEKLERPVKNQTASARASKPRRLTAAVASRYGRALDAMDRKDVARAKKELEAVLEAQPDFSLAQADLAMLAR